MQAQMQSPQDVQMWNYGQCHQLSENPEQAVAKVLLHATEVQAAATAAAAAAAAASVAGQQVFMLCGGRVYFVTLYGMDLASD
eukprot:6204632-Pleurochrysis_carterae.AAC.3